MLIVALAVAALGALVPAVAHAKRPDLKVARVPVPNPPGTFAGGDMAVRHVIANGGRGRARKRSGVSYFLSMDRKHSADDVRLRKRRHRLVVPRLRPGARRRGRLSAVVPRRVEPGVHRLIACADVANRVKESREGNNCTTSRHSIPIHRAQDAPPGFGPPTAGPEPPAKEYYPERDYDDVTDLSFNVGGADKCPASTHGQGFPTTNAFYTDRKSFCVWVTTPRFDDASAFTKYFDANEDPTYSVFGLFYCPHDYPFPFLVAIGTDPLWADLSQNTSSNAIIGTVKREEYTYSTMDEIGTKFPYSWAGFSGPGTVKGYVSFLLPPKSDTDLTESGRAQYLCSDTGSDLSSPQ